MNDCDLLTIFYINIHYMYIYILGVSSQKPGYVKNMSNSQIICIIVELIFNGWQLFGNFETIYESFWVSVLSSSEFLNCCHFFSAKSDNLFRRNMISYIIFNSKKAWILPVNLPEFMKNYTTFCLEHGPYIYIYIRYSTIKLKRFLKICHSLYI